MSAEPPRTQPDIERHKEERTFHFRMPDAETHTAADYTRGNITYAPTGAAVTWTRRAASPGAWGLAWARIEVYGQRRRADTTLGTGRRYLYELNHAPWALDLAQSCLPEGWTTGRVITAP